MEAQSLPPAPAVVAVLVTHDPGPWLEDALASLRAQDYPNMSVLVIDAGSGADPTARVASTFPEAYIRRLDGGIGFASAVNEVLSMVEGASHYLLCHDDVALYPDAVRLLVEEAYRSNAGVATPKYVEWDAPDRLLAVGGTTDRVGVLRPMIERGELDQGQHDAVREVLVAPGGATLVRADLFAALGGFDPMIDGYGEDVDLSWRARLAGARVIVVPAARVRHLEATASGLRETSAGALAPDVAQRVSETNRLRTLITCYRWFDLLWALPLAVVWLLGEALSSLARGRREAGWSQLAALGDVWHHPVSRWRVRRRAQARRQVGDASVRRLQVRGNTRLRTFLRESRLGAAGAVSISGNGSDAGLFSDWEDLEGTDPAFTGDRADSRKRSDRDRHSGPGTIAWKWVGVVALALGLVLLFGSRNLIGHRIPLVGQIPDTSGGWSSLWRSWWSAWQPGGLGAAAPSSPAIGFLGVGATILLGAVGVLQHVAVLGTLVVGPIGAYRAARWWGSRRAQVAGMVAYAVVPVPYNALAQGHWGGLVAFAAAPWVVSWLARQSEDVPFPTEAVRRVWAPVIALGALTAVVASVAPSFLLVVPLVGLGLLAGSALAGGGGGVAMLRTAALASVGAIVLLLPWSLPLFGSGVALFGPSPGPSGRLGFAQVLLFHTGPFGSGLLGWFLLAAAALPLVIGNTWRLSWATRMWTVALLLFVVVWAGRRGWVPAIPVEVALAPAAAALASSVALGAAAFELDLPGYRFGWRQLAATGAAVALGLASVQLLSASLGGRWKLPSADASSVLGFLPASHGGDYRVLWVGAPDALPLAGRQLSPGMAYGTSYNGLPALTEQWVSSPAGATDHLGTDLQLVEKGLTTKLGHLLAPAGVLYVIVVDRNGPKASGSLPEPVPGALMAGLALQTDLQAVGVGDPAYSVFENAAWAPVKSVLAPDVAEAATSIGGAGDRALQQLDLTGSAPVLSSGAKPAVRPGSTVYFGSSRTSGWRLEAGGRSVGSHPAFGWAMSFAVPATGSPYGSEPARLSYSSPPWIRLGDLLVVLIWIAAVALLVFDRRRRSSIPPPRVDPEWFQPLTLTTAQPRHRQASRRRPAAVGAVTDEEMWSGE
jgi:GT2 family glycosyltransferase